METAIFQAALEELVAVAIESTLNPVQEDVLMTTESNANHEAAVNQSLLTSDITINTSASIDEVTEVSTNTADPEHIINLKKAFNIAINNPGFVKDQKKVEKLTESLALVDPETRVRAQLETNAYKTLRAKAAKIAEQPGGIYVAPTKVEIDKYIEDGLKVWRDKQK